MNSDTSFLSGVKLKRIDKQQIKQQEEQAKIDRELAEKLAKTEDEVAAENILEHQKTVKEMLKGPLTPE
jgi:hypothetical protein